MKPRNTQSHVLHDSGNLMFCGFLSRNGNHWNHIKIGIP